MKLSSLLTLTLVLSLTTTVASAQEAPQALVSTKAKPCPCPKAFNGFYIGGNVGYGTGTIRHAANINGLNPLSGAFSTDRKGVQGFDGGAIVGYTYIFRNKMGLGLEGYFNWSSTRATISGTDLRGNGQNQRFYLRNSAQLRVPLSYVIADLVAPKIMLGWDNSKWINTFQYAGGQSNAYSNTRYNGFLWGCGVDFLIAKNVVSGLEYTGVISQNVTFADIEQNGLTFSNRPIYNKFAWTIKYIF